MYKVNDYLSLMSKKKIFLILKLKKKAGMTGSVRNKRKSFIDKWHKRRCIIRGLLNYGYMQFKSAVQ